jgi:transcriptional regulator EpsA
MNRTDNGGSGGQAAVADAVGGFPGSASAITLAPQQATAERFALTASEVDLFLRIVSRASVTRRHYELFQLLQGEVQYFLPHQILICAWGDFRGSPLMLDVVSALPGVRTAQLNGCPIGDALRGLYERWLTQGRAPLLLDQAALAGLAQRRCECALHRSLRGMRSAVVHGSDDARHGVCSLYFASNANAMVAQDPARRLGHLVDPVIAQIDVAFRRVGSLRAPSAISAREEEILEWVSEGKTNRQISEILDISSFTVKNHIHRIIRKLGVANRTEAVAKYRQLSGAWQSRSPRGSAVSAVSFAE